MRESTSRREKQIEDAGPGGGPTTTGATRRLKVLEKSSLDLEYHREKSATGKLPRVASLRLRDKSHLFGQARDEDGRGN